MNKSLVPLILILALIVLLTVIISNTRTTRDNRRVTLESEGRASIRLSPYQQRREVRLSPSEADYSEKQEIAQALMRAYMAFDAGRLGDASDQSKTVLIFEPENNAALALLGRIYYQQGKYREAEKIFRKQIEFSGDDAVVYNNLGQALAKQHKFDAAATHLTMAYELDPDAPQVSLNLSGIYSVKGMKEQSLFYLKKAFEALGEQILTIAADPTLDNIRGEPEFRQIIEEAQARQQQRDVPDDVTGTTKP